MFDWIFLWIALGVVVAESNRFIYHQYNTFHYLSIVIFWPLQLMLNWLDYFKVPLPPFIRNFALKEKEKRNANFRNRL